MIEFIALLKENDVVARQMIAHAYLPISALMSRQFDSANLFWLCCCAGRENALWTRPVNLRLLKRQSTQFIVISS